MQATGFSLLVRICFLVLIDVLIVAVGDRVFRKGIACRFPGGGGGGGGTLNFSCYVGLDPASTVYQKISGIAGIPQTIFEILATLKHIPIRVLINSKFGLFYSNFLILTPTFTKVPIEKYGKTPIFSGKQHFYSYFENPSENSAHYVHYVLCSLQKKNLKCIKMTPKNIHKIFIPIFLNPKK